MQSRYMTVALEWWMRQSANDQWVVAGPHPTPVYTFKVVIVMRPMCDHKSACQPQSAASVSHRHLASPDSATTVIQVYRLYWNLMAC